MITYEMKRNRIGDITLFSCSPSQEEKKNYFDRIKKQQALNERRHPTQEHFSCYEKQKTNQKLERIIVEGLVLLKCCLLIRLLFRSIELIETRQRMPSSVNKEKKEHV